MNRALDADIAPNVRNRLAACRDRADWGAEFRRRRVADFCWDIDLICPAFMRNGPEANFRRIPMPPLNTLTDTGPHRSTTDHAGAQATSAATSDPQSPIDARDDSSPISEQLMMR